MKILRIATIFLLPLVGFVSCVEEGGDMRPVRSEVRHNQEGNMWSIRSEARHYQKWDSSQDSKSSSSILAPIVYFGSLPSTAAMDDDIGRLMPDVDKFVVMTRVNVDNGIFQTNLLLRSDLKPEWKHYVIKVIDEKPGFLRKAKAPVNDKRLSPLLKKLEDASGLVDCSRYFVMDATTVYFSWGNRTEVDRCAVYAPEESDERLLGSKAGSLKAIYSELIKITRGTSL